MGICESASKGIRRVLDDAQVAIAELQVGISAASADWSDKKYSEFANALRSLSDESVGIFECGELCVRELGEFESIAEERY
jgi:hypothetical protein